MTAAWPGPAQPSPPAARRALPPRKASAAPPGRAHRHLENPAPPPLPPRCCRALLCQAGRGRASPAGQRQAERHRARGSAAASIFPGRGPFKSSPSSRDRSPRVTGAARSVAMATRPQVGPGPEWLRLGSRCRDLAAAGAPQRPPGSPGRPGPGPLPVPSALPPRCVYACGVRKARLKDPAPREALPGEKRPERSSGSAGCLFLGLVSGWDEALP